MMSRTLVLACVTQYSLILILFLLKPPGALGNDEDKPAAEVDPAKQRETDLKECCKNLDFPGSATILDADQREKRCLEHMNEFLITHDLPTKALILLAKLVGDLQKVKDIVPRLEARTWNEKAITIIVENIFQNFSSKDDKHLRTEHLLRIVEYAPADWWVMLFEDKIFSAVFDMGKAVEGMLEIRRGMTHFNMYYEWYKKAQQTMSLKNRDRVGCSYEAVIRFFDAFKKRTRVRGPLPAQEYDELFAIICKTVIPTDEQISRVDVFLRNDRLLDTRVENIQSAYGATCKAVLENSSWKTANIIAFIAECKYEAKGRGNAVGEKESARRSVDGERQCVEKSVREIKAFAMLRLKPEHMSEFQKKVEAEEHLNADVLMRVLQIAAMHLRLGTAEGAVDERHAPNADAVYGFLISCARFLAAIDTGEHMATAESALHALFHHVWKSKWPLEQTFGLLEDLRKLARLSFSHFEVFLKAIDVQDIVKLRKILRMFNEIGFVTDGARYENSWALPVFYKLYVLYEYGAAPEGSAEAKSTTAEEKRSIGKMIKHYLEGSSYGVDIPNELMVRIAEYDDALDEGQKLSQKDYDAVFSAASIKTYVENENETKSYAKILVDGAKSKKPVAEVVEELRNSTPEEPTTGDGEEGDEDKSETKATSDSKTKSSDKA